MISQKEKAIVFKSLHERQGCFIIPNPWDTGTSKILTTLGFEALATTSAGLAFSLGRPDLCRKLSLEEILQNAREILSSTDLPVSADLENGYSDSPEGVYNTIIKAGEIGLVGASIEDATGIENNPIYDFDLSVERIKAAVEAKKTFNFPFMLTARSENFVHERFDLKDTIRRLQAFQEAGADVLYAPDLRNLEEISAVVKSLDKPVNVMIGTSFTVSDLEKAGVKRISLGSLLVRSALGEVIRSAKEIKEKGTCSFAESATPFGELMGIFKER
jgi:2-methylisocitrate lyase-like PEP mutase family enzyme